MKTWMILSNYQTCGLAFAVKVEQNRIRRSMRLRPELCRRMALQIVRTALVQSINNGSFYHAA